jgi:hypothetical protein
LIRPAIADAGGKAVSQLLDNLRAFNRKERFFVVGWALDNPDFRLGLTFRQQLKRDTTLQVPASAFCAMDFHLDWLLGCLHITKEERARYSMLETGDMNKKNDDVDLLVAYEQSGTTHLLLIEAKGVTGWHNAQLVPKASRLGLIFGDRHVAHKWPGVTPHWILASPRRPQQIDVSTWPGWMKVGGKPQWVRLPIPEGLRKIVRCDESGKKAAEGEWWRVVPPARPKGSHE